MIIERYCEVLIRLYVDIQEQIDREELEEKRVNYVMTSKTRHHRRISSGCNFVCVGTRHS